MPADALTSNVNRASAVALLVVVKGEFFDPIEVAVENGGPSASGRHLG